jgi:SAM-dependent methyltransferase
MGDPAGWQRRVQEFVLGQIGDPPARVLEVGCGKGELARALARAGHRVTAIDPRAPEGPIFRSVGIEEFSDAEPFDHVVASLSLHHVEDLGRALDKVVEEFQERFGLEAAREWIEKGFEDDRTQSWRGVLKAKLEKLYDDEHSGDLRDSVREYVQESVKGDEDEDDE